MMQFLCDRCGKQIQASKEFKVDVSTDKIKAYELYDNFLPHYDLCDDCFRDLKRFVAEGKNGNA